MRFRVFVAISVLALLVIVGAAFVAATTASDLIAARRALEGSVDDLDAREIEDAQRQLASARERMDGWVASVLGVVPIVGQNLGALEAVADGAEPVLDAALDLKTAVDGIRDGSLVEGGRVRLDLLERLAVPLADEADSLAELETKLADARSGWLLPPVYDQLIDLAQRAGDLRATASKAAAAADLAPGMLGGSGPRTYLVILINNAELRGAGGILSGVGTVTMSDGRIRLGDFDPYGELGSAPYEKVEAPPEFERRFGFAKADTTLWINTTYSPEVPDVALVASRLYEKVRGVATDGAIVVDPRGIASLMPPGATVASPSGGELNAETLPDYIYSDAYAELGGNSSARRGALLDIGRDVFKLLAERGPGDLDELEDISGAVGGGHLRFVSFTPDEEELLERTDASGSLPEATDSVFVNVQNHGPDKLDFWIRRSVAHGCSVAEGEATCRTSATLRNVAPHDLSSYVSPRPGERSNEFLEIYTPGDADVTTVELDGAPVRFLADTQGDRKAFGTDVSIESGERATLSVTYTLPLRGSYDLTITPQPLAHDAALRVDIETPEGWTVRGPEGADEDGLAFRGPLDATLRFAAGPTPESGWTSFWKDPLL